MESSVFIPKVKTIQRMALYETKSKFYLVGSNNTQTLFRVLKIDRLENRQLDVSDDKTVYTTREIRDLLTMIDVGNRSKIGQKIGSGLTKTVSAFGLAGFVRFLEGFYIVLITKRRKVGVIGHHTIYKIEDTSMIYIPPDTKEQHPDEQRYLKMFQATDLSSNFYFSYSYDLTHSLQYNLSNPVFLSQTPTEDPIRLSQVSGIEKGSFTYIPQYQEKFVWNQYLLKDLGGIDADWKLPIIHGFVDQSNVSIYGKPVYVTLIARRSKNYAGTRFLKRGANFEGDCGNEVETEQIACDASIGSDNMGHYTSFVQMRGSVPFQWSQDISKIQPKPPIFIETQDPFAMTAGKHFNELLERHGSPVVVINLVKKRERRKHESLLSEEFTKQISYLNQFLPEDHKIHYIHFDMARCNKAKEANVMGRLSNIAYRTVKETGIFHSRSTPFLHFQPAWAAKHTADLLKISKEKGDRLPTLLRQTGIIRTNCVDCLDRTNTAQFAVGKCALAFQLHALGVLKEPQLEFDTDCVRMLEEMYEDQGDTLALQYGGSALVHRIKSYRKLAPWTSKGNDIMQTMRRYYSNTLSDAEKQNTMNVFLGIFVPSPGRPPIWEKEFNFDYYLHHKKLQIVPRPLTQWWRAALVNHLPLSSEINNKPCIQLNRAQNMTESTEDYYHPFELTVLQDLFAFSEINHSVRDYMPNFTTDFSPFSARVRLGKKREEMSSSKTNLSMKNPSVAGNSTSSTTSTEDDSDQSGSESSDSEPSYSERNSLAGDRTNLGYVSFESLFPSMKSVYGMEVRDPSPEDMQLYRRNAALSRESGPVVTGRRMSTTSVPHPLAKPILRKRACAIPVHDYSKVLLRPVSDESMKIYQKYIQVGETGPCEPDAASLDIYRNYVNMAALAR